MKDMINKLVELKDKIAKIEGREISDNDFAKRYLKFSSTTWSRLQSDTYAGSTESVMDKMSQSIEEIEAMLPAIEAGAGVGRSFVKTTLAKSVLSAVNRARTGVDGRKVVVCLAPTGYGKTAIRDYLASRGAITVEGRQAWRSSYRAFCLDIARAAGRKLSAGISADRLEDEMLSVLRSRNGVLYIDEANVMNGACANSIKLIANTTGYTVVIAAIPQLWDKFLAGNRDEVAQLINRCQPILRAGKISEADVRLFVTAEIAAIPEAVRSITRCANQFGGFRTVVAMANHLSEIGSPTIADVEKEVQQHTANISASGFAM